MAKTPARHHKQWTPQEERKLDQLADGNTPTRLIAMKMGRTTAAIYKKASEENIPLKPTNQSPYNRRRR